MTTISFPGLPEAPSTSTPPEDEPLMYSSEFVDLDERCAALVALDGRRMPHTRTARKQGSFFLQALAELADISRHQ